MNLRGTLSDDGWSIGRLIAAMWIAREADVDQKLRPGLPTGR